MKILPKKLRDKTVKEIKMLLHASRDCLRNQHKDTRNIGFSIFDGYYCEAFGILRGLKLFNYGYFGPVNLDAVRDGKSEVSEHNLIWWFDQIKKVVLHEEGFGGDNVCKHCLEHYGKDSNTCATWE